MRLLRTGFFTFFLVSLSACLTTSGSSVGLEQGDLEQGVRPIPMDADVFAEDEIASVTRQFVAFLDKSSSPASEINLYGRRLASITRSLRRIGLRKYNYRVYLSPKMNTFSLPDGSIRLTGGLLDLLSDDELRYLLAEQIALVENGISVRRLSAAYATVDAKLADNLTDEELISLDNEFMNLSVPLEEFEKASAYASRFLKNNRIDSAAAASAQKKLAALSPASAYRRSYPRLIADTPKQERLPQRDAPAELVGAELVGAKLVEAEEPAVDSSMGIITPTGSSADELPIKSATLGAKVRPSSPAEPVAGEIPAPPVDPAPEKISAESPASNTEDMATLDSQPLVLESLLPGWYVQVAADTSREEAGKRHQQAQAKDLPVQLQRTIVNGVEYYRTLVGPYSTKVVAKTKRQSVEVESFVKGTPFLKRVQ